MAFRPKKNGHAISDEELVRAYHQGDNTSFVELISRYLDLIDAMIKSADESVSDQEVANIEQNACPTCGCCSGMFTANSMNSLTEAIGLSLPGNGTILATHKNRIQLFKDAARQIVKNAYAYYEDGDESVLPRNIATRDAFLNAMTLDIAMGGSTNTVLHLPGSSSGSWRRLQDGRHRPIESQGALPLQVEP